jgi:TPP-dependent pyruvate/acetoin dehydrogenase alpha subunit
MYGMSIPVEASTAGASVAHRAAAYHIPGESCDGMDLLAVREKTAGLIEHVRAGRGPALLELKTYRYCGHSKNDPRVYRTREEEAEWHANDCIARTAAVLAELGVPEDQIGAVRSDTERQVKETVEEALAAPAGDREHALGGVYA